MRVSRFAVVALALSLAIMGSACAPDGAEPPDSVGSGEIMVALNADGTTFDRAAPLALRFTLTNFGAESRHVLIAHTPLDGIDADIFEVERDGQPVPYEGKLVKMAEPQAEDFVEVAAGATLTGTFDPSEAYDMSLPGNYTVRYRAPALVAVAPKGMALRMRAQPQEFEDIGSDSVGMELKGQGETPEHRNSAGGRPGGGGGQTCSETQKSTLRTAALNATTISGKALGYLQSRTADPDSLYKTWFDYSGDRRSWNAVEDHFTDIYGAFSSNLATFDCSCKKRYYAYVYPNQPYLIYVCSVFWQAPMVGQDSKAGTLVHEMSHFDVLSSTDDWVYGAAGAMSLAQTDVSKSTTNADNHEYFAEKQP